MRNDTSGIGTGILLITIGLLFMADRQGYMGFGRLWPVILIVLGGVRLLFPSDSPKIPLVVGFPGSARRYRRGRSSGLWLVLVGVIFLAHQNHWMHISQSWPLFIVAGGLVIIFGGLGRRSPVIDTTNQGGGQ